MHLLVRIGVCSCVHVHTHAHVYVAPGGPWEKARSLTLNLAHGRNEAGTPLLL